MFFNFLTSLLWVLADAGCDGASRLSNEPCCSQSRQCFGGMTCSSLIVSTYNHRLVRTGHPVRSAILKHQIGGSVVGWVTTSESPLLYVYHFILFLLPMIRLEFGWSSVEVVVKNVGEAAGLGYGIATPDRPPEFPLISRPWFL